MDIVMRDFGGMIVFLHIFSAVVWVGGMIAVKMAVHPALQNITDLDVQVARGLEVMDNLFRIVLPFVVTLLITAIMLQIGLGLTGDLVSIKQGIWTLMFFNFVWMILKRNSGQKKFIMGQTALAKEAIKPISRVMLPINILLGIVAIYLGVSLRGF